MKKSYVKALTFIGEVGTRAVDEFEGFHLNQRYTLRYAREDAGVVTIELDHLPYAKQLVVTAAEFERWFVQ